MKLDTKNILIFLYLILILGCSNSGDPLSENYDESAFGIYFLKDTLITEKDIRDISIDSLELNNEPWLSLDDIEFYDYSSHCIYLKKDKSLFFDNYQGKYFPFNHLLISKPFIVVADKERCYIGALHSGALSSSPIGPSITELDVGFFPIDVLHISKDWFNDVDSRVHSKVEDVLIENGLFHAGLSIELTSFKIIDNSDTTTIEYSIVINNHDTDNLFVLDPEKMGSELFHYFTNGPNLRNSNTSKYYYSQFKEINEPDTYDSWESNWFTIIKSGESIERTIRLKGYPRVPNGNYFSEMKFSNPNLISKDKRYIDDGRIWIGEIMSNKLSVTIE